MKPIDWRETENYPGLSKDWCNSSSRWAWEFMRRNAEYEVDRERWTVAWGDGLYPADEAYQVRRELADKWGVTCHMSCWPESDDPLGFQSLIWSLHGLMSFSGAKVRPDSPRRTGDQWEEYLQVRRSEVWIRFDLEEKLDRQLEAAKSSLTNIRESLQIATPTHRLRKPEKLQQYLRVWDAVQGGAARSEIAEELYPEIPNSYPEHSGNDQVGNDLKVADELISFGFLALKIQYPEASSMP